MYFAYLVNVLANVSWIFLTLKKKTYLERERVRVLSHLLVYTPNAHNRARLSQNQEPEAPSGSHPHPWQLALTTAASHCAAEHEAGISNVVGTWTQALQSAPWMSLIFGNSGGEIVSLRHAHLRNCMFFCLGFVIWLFPLEIAS